ncbi:MAG: outer membrane protein OmpA-like peptidoglycan-associated protein [Alphaproteobacteria bacterium]|jgi:outer membrane protein OmpA-like peptidoglycan-associated protein
MYQKFGISALVACGIIFAVAANYQNQGQRQASQAPAYGDLLSKAYKSIVLHEKQKGTFSNIDYFELRSQEAIHRYNPRPLTTSGLVHNKKNRRELRLSRFELERFMNGYAGRIASQDVAMMHAAFDCRVKNIEMNHKMDKACKILFAKHRQKAARVVDNYLKKDTIQAPAITRTPPPVAAVKPLNVPINTPIKPFNSAPKKPLPILKQPQVPVISVVPNQPVMPDTMRNKSLPALMQPQVTAIPPRPAVKPLLPSVQNMPNVTNKEGATIKEMPKTTNPIKNNIEDEVAKEGKSKKFNPLNYIHPSLRKRALEIQRKKQLQLEQPALKPQTNAVPYGIQPTSRISVPEIKNGYQKYASFKSMRGQRSKLNETDSFTKQSSFKLSPIMNYKPKASAKKMSTNSITMYDPTPTASINPAINQMKSATASIPFTSSVNITPDGFKGIKEIGMQLKNSNNRIVTIIGHADQGKSSIIDTQMSLKRAQKIKQILQTYNKEIKIIIQAMGASEPLKGLSQYDNRNRRAEIIVQ